MDPLDQRISSAVFAFRGYNVTNLGRTPELLAHKAYGPTVARYLREGSDICSDLVHRKIDLVGRVERKEETSLNCYDEAMTLIVAVELAQLRLLAEFFDVRYQKARFAFGYSLGELSAVIVSGLYEMEHALRLPLEMAADCVALAEDVTMGVVFSRGPVLDFGRVERLCVRINLEGRGVVGVSSFLAPNAVLILGQGDTVDRFGAMLHDTFPSRVYLRKNPDRWPPMHTPLVWQRNIPNRAGIIMHTLPGGLQRPSPPVFSLVTGDFGYNDHNSREILNRWIDHPQRLWDAIYETLAQGIKTVIHVGPDPNLVLATFNRLSDNVRAQLTGRSLNSMGLRAMSRAVTRPWLGALLPSRTAMLRAPMVEHIVLENWLLEQNVK
jgi:[acyl-carrier-protein] S-malonyltransferase